MKQNYQKKNVLLHTTLLIKYSALYFANEDSALFLCLQENAYNTYLYCAGFNCSCLFFFFIII